MTRWRLQILEEVSLPSVTNDCWNVPETKTLSIFIGDDGVFKVGCTAQAQHRNDSLVTV